MSYQMRPLQFDNAPAGVILCGIAVANKRYWLASELVEQNTEYLQSVLDNNPDYAGFTLGSIAYVIARRLDSFHAQ